MRPIMNQWTLEYDRNVRTMDPQNATQGLYHLGCRRMHKYTHRAQCTL